MAGTRALTPVARTMSSNSAEARVSASARVPRRTSTPSLSSRTVKYRSSSLNSALPGTTRARLIWPPRVSPASSRVTRCPSSAALTAKARPAGPAPTTAMRLRTRGSRRVNSISCPARGLTMQLAVRLVKIRSRHAWLHPMHVLISSLRPVRTLAAKSGSASSGRAIDTRSPVPSASSSSARSGSLMRLETMTGTDTASLTFFRSEVGVGEQRPRHRHQVARPVGQQLLGQIGVVDAVGDDDRNRHGVLDVLRRERPRSARDAGRDRRNRGLVPSDSRVEDVRASHFDPPGEIGDLLARHAAVDEVDGRDAVDEQEVLADPFPGGRQDLDREPAATLEASAEVVVAEVVRQFRGELVDQVSL